MIHFYKVLTSLFLSGITFAVTHKQAGDIYLAGPIAGVVLLVSFILLYGESNFFPKLKADVLFCAGLGALLGLAIAWFVGAAVHFEELNVAFYFLFALFGILSGVAFAKEPGLGIFGGGGSGNGFGVGIEKEEVRDKILDTSVVIDGRILDIADTHFLDGPLILPNFVLREIQLISDSSDPIKRARGRRGLEMLNKLQRKGSIEVKITYKDYSDTREVDAKLIKLARDTGGKIVTNDFNLNKVAELQGVKVLNLNTLANALKPVVLPGEELGIQVIKEGKDENQGIGYLEDGTMVVIENGGHLVGKEVKVTVTSIIQTAAGKMIFTKANSNGVSEKGNRQPHSS
ncbi:PIN/TRAM domain-containing protein [Leptospira interrogans]|uniref:Integral membrane protein with PIN domain n=21 Tax=Leptospira interrogans TaxID=173 RepID=Q8F9E5_LEPIN|nr:MULTISPECIES: PIN domain-containing protein [Leptospira]APH40224.1 TRAM domain protein [Leptospira interrogans serovar Copenhageni/Icterohaemorrhagiae]EMF43466.1 TRAM domain protein [Leptospira interrogans serovar Lora str. TE 1992]EMF72559.1 TRAM domain protein [Leptospira interrogans serovar Canicola str. LT1962]EMG10080.1 TRAM domain protein [Leptospira interrogans serovar Grippotyphosa str. LT2186]EMM83100.1 TRAM domain protein [Leptospira interrogans str. 2006001854]EMM93455.1 TRAM do